MTDRRPLPNRRAAVAFDYEHAGAAYHAHVGFFPDGKLGEIFLNAERANSMLDVISNDGAVLVSMLLQYGVALSEIRHSLKRNGDESAGSPIGAALDFVTTIEGDRR